MQATPSSSDGGTGALALVGLAFVLARRRRFA
jgi:MYXO-CTERM domain-containing protein